MPDLTPEQRQQVAFAVALRPLWAQGATKNAFIQLLSDLADQEKAEIEDIVDKIGDFSIDGKRYTLTDEDNRRIEFARVRQRVFSVELTSYIASIVQEAGQIVGHPDLSTFELSE